MGPSYNLPNIYMACCPSYILPKTNEDKTRSTKTKNLNPEARLQNEKMLGTHSTQTKFGLLDSCDQCTFLCMSWMICWTCDTKIKSHKFIYEWSLFFCLKKKIRSILIGKKIDFDLSKYQICFVGCKKKKKWFLMKKIQIFFYYIK